MAALKPPATNVDSVVKGLELKFAEWHKMIKCRKGRCTSDVDQKQLHSKLGVIINTLDVEQGKLRTDDKECTRVQNIQMEKDELETRLKEERILREDAERQVQNTKDTYKVYLAESKRKQEILSENLAKAHRNLGEASRAKNEALSRLSEVAGLRVHKDNPGIADLSDQQRPTKIAEGFRELYNNEWTESLEQLNEQYEIPEENVIQDLLGILRDSYVACDIAANVQTDNLKTCVLSLHPRLQSKSSKQELAELTSESVDLIHRLRKSVASITSHDVKKQYLGDLEKRYRQNTFMMEVVEPYATTCVELCWLMCAQNPPMMFNYNVRSGDQVNKDTFTYYTTKGEFVHYLVWPALLLHKDGPIMSKGIVQGKTENT